MGRERKDKKVALFKAECLLNKLPFSRVGIIYPFFWDCLYDVVSQKPHEQRSVHTGVIFTKEFEEVSFHLKNNSFVIRDYYLDESADGRSVFCLLSKIETENKTLIFNHELTQTELLSFVEDERKNTVIVVRSDMEVRVFYHGTISIYENRDWMLYVKKEELRSILSNNLKLTPQLERILFFAYYDLAIEKIGASLVFHTEKGCSWEGVKSKEMEKPINLNDDIELALVKKYAITHDGALLIENDVFLVGKNAKLMPKPETVDTIDNEYHFGGTRHTSSCAYTREYPNTIIITTSDDGGATIFSKGVIVLSNNRICDLSKKLQSSNGNNTESLCFNTIIEKPLQGLAKMYSNKHAVENTIDEKLEALQLMAEQYDEYSDITYTSQKCPKCGQLYNIGYIRITGWNDHEELRCIKCGTMYYSKSCFELLGEPVLKKEYSIEKTT